MRKRILIALSFIAIIVFVFAIGTGAVSIPMRDVLRVLSGKIPLINKFIDSTTTKSTQTIILKIRLPRVILGMLVGASLSTAGAVLQGLFKNPMADPYIVGVSAGAGLGAVIAMVLRIDIWFWGLSSVPILAFLTGLGTTLLVYSIAQRSGYLPMETFLLAGIAIGSVASAMTSFMIMWSKNEILHGVIYWLMGGLSTSSWDKVRMILPYTCVGILIVLSFSRDLNIMTLGEESAQHLGIDIEVVKKILLATTSLLTAAAVSVSGLIGFIGLIIPHIMRIIIGPDHRFLLPASIITGGLFLALADVGARTILAPIEIPVGIITACLGGPFFAYLLRGKRKMF